MRKKIATNGSREVSDIVFSPSRGCAQFLEHGKSCGVNNTQSSYKFRSHLEGSHRKMMFPVEFMILMSLAAILL